jgi:hypothetical protein
LAPENATFATFFATVSPLFIGMFCELARQRANMAPRSALELNHAGSFGGFRDVYFVQKIRAARPGNSE